MKIEKLVLAALLPIAAASATTVSAPSHGFWGQWRGPSGTGVAPLAKPPVEWSETKNVRFKVEIPGRGSSSPIVWGDQVILTTAVALPEGKLVPAEGLPAKIGSHPDVSAPKTAQQFVVMAVSRHDGKTVWSRVVKEDLPHEGTHKDGSFASGSAATDGERIYAFFGSRGLYCLDMKGQPVWQKDFGKMVVKMSFGEGSSPALYGNRVVVNWDHEGDSFILALDAKTGKELWRTPRTEKTTWATPVVIAHKGKPQVVTSASETTRAYDLETGKQIWQGPGLTPNAIPTPVHQAGMLYATSGFRGNALFAIRLDAAQGDLAGTPAIAWSYDKDTPYVPSPLLYDGGLYFLKSNSAILTRLDAATGEKSFSERLPGANNVYASPVAADGRVYVFDRDGAAVVIEKGAAFKVLATNQLEDGFDASPALAGADIFVRGKKHLYRIAEPAAR